MTTRILRPIFAGIVLGAAVFFFPFFLLRVLLIVLVIGALFTLFRRRGYGRHYRGYYLSFADKVRNMTEDEYRAFKERCEHTHYRREPASK